MALERIHTLLQSRELYYLQISFTPEAQTLPRGESGVMILMRQDHNKGNPTPPHRFHGRADFHCWFCWRGICLCGSACPSSRSSKEKMRALIWLKIPVVLFTPNKCTGVKKCKPIAPWVVVGIGLPQCENCVVRPYHARPPMYYPSSQVIIIPGFKYYIDGLCLMTSHRAWGDIASECFCASSWHKWVISRPLLNLLHNWRDSLLVGFVVHFFLLKDFHGTYFLKVGYDKNSAFTFQKSVWLRSAPQKRLGSIIFSFAQTRNATGVQIR